MNLHFLVLTVICLVTQVSAAEIFKGCVDPTGKAVATIYDNSLNNMAYAKLTHAYKPIIMINKKAIASLSVGTQNFIYWHECGHISLGHLMQQKQAAIIEEQAADAYGIRVSLTLGLIKHSQLPKLQEDLSRLGQGDWEHLSGVSRAMNIEKCLGDGYAEVSWSACKTKFYSNIDFINKSTGMLKQLLAGCRNKGFKNPDCIQAQVLAGQLNSGIQNATGAIDQECPFVMEPAFNKAIASYSRAFTQLLNGK